MYVRHANTTIFAALRVATGKATETCTEPHRHSDLVMGEHKWFNPGAQP
jgi:hypothetical protein